MDRWRKKGNTQGWDVGDSYDEGEIRRKKTQRTESWGREKLRPGNVSEDKTWRDINENHPIC